jgi:hypothetical protein
LRGNKKLRDLIAWAPSAIKQRVCCAFNYDLGKDESWAGERGKQHVHPSLSISLSLGIGLEIDLIWDTNLLWVSQPGSFAHLFYHNSKKCEQENWVVSRLLVKVYSSAVKKNALLWILKINVTCKSLRVKN